jgi:hypothetical protein
MIVEPGMPLIEGHSARQTGVKSDTNEERHARDDEPDGAGNEVDIATVKDRD